MSRTDRFTMTSAVPTARGYAIDLVIDADDAISGTHDHGDLVPLGIDLLDGVLVATYPSLRAW